MLRFKSCPRCKGTLVVDRDHYGWYEQCLQCAYLGDIQGTVEVHQHGERKLARKSKIWDEVEEVGGKVRASRNQV